MKQSTKTFFLIILLISLTGSFLVFPVHATTTETRYMRSDQQTVNGLLAYQLGIAQSASALSVSTTAKSQSVDDTLRPTSDISVGFPENYPPIPPPDPNPHYVDVDDVVADDLSSFVVTGESTSYVYDRYGKATYSLPAGSKIGLVRITARGYTEYPTLTTHQAVFAFGVYIGTTYYVSADQKTNNAWATRTYDLIRNPATGLAWTQDNINNMQIALRAKSYNEVSSGYQYAYITQVYVEIYVYTDDTVYYSVDVVKRDSAGTETAIGTKVAEWSGLISALYDSAGLKSATWACPETALASTDSIIVKAYQKVGAGSWSFVRNFTTEQLGASKLDAATWTVYYYLDISANASYVYTVFWHGTSTYNSRIENFTWTPPQQGTNLTVNGSITETFSISSQKTMAFNKNPSITETFSIQHVKSVSFSRSSLITLTTTIGSLMSYTTRPILNLFGIIPMTFSVDNSKTANFFKQSILTLTTTIESLYSKTINLNLFGLIPFTFNLDNSKTVNFLRESVLTLTASIDGTMSYTRSGTILHLFGVIPVTFTPNSIRTWIFNTYPSITFTFSIIQANTLPTPATTPSTPTGKGGNAPTIFGLSQPQKVAVAFVLLAACIVVAVKANQKVRRKKPIGKARTDTEQSGRTPRLEADKYSGDRPLGVGVKGEEYDGERPLGKGKKGKWKHPRPKKKR